MEPAADVTFTCDESLLGGVDEVGIAGMERHDPAYNRWEYLAGTVDTDANTVTVSDVTAFSRWKLLASTPPLAIADLAASRSGSDLVLDWSSVTQDIKGQAITGVTYNIYRAANDPYFIPGSTPFTQDQTSSSQGSNPSSSTTFRRVAGRGIVPCASHDLAVAGCTPT